MFCTHVNKHITCSAIKFKSISNSFPLKKNFKTSSLSKCFAFFSTNTSHAVHLNLEVYQTLLIYKYYTTSSI